MTRGLEGTIPTWVRFAVVSLAFLSANAAWAQTSPYGLDPYGGFTPTADYCASTGGCFTSMEAAVAAMRAATPDVGQLLAAEDRQYSSSTYVFYHVPDQAPVSYGNPLYGVDGHGVIGGDGYCPNSLATQDRPTDWGGSYCYDEMEMYNGFVAGPKSCGWHSCTFQDFSIVGDYVEPYSSTSSTQFIRWISQTEYIRVNGANEGWLQYSINNKYIRYFENDHTDGVLRERTARMVKYRRFVCPAGMRPINTTDVNVNPKLCRSAVRPYVQIKKLKQQESCPVNGNPCHPSSGDKSRAEADFTFAGRSFTRHYHSLREIGPKYFRMGQGWTHTFSTWLYPPGGNAPGLYTGTGYRMPIVYISANKYYVPSLNNASLEKLADGTWVLSEPGGDVTTFSALGVIITIRNASSPERDVDIEYDANGRLASIVDNAGRVLSFTYDAANLLTMATLPDGSSVSYAYDAQENLISADHGAGRVKHYSYGEAGLSTNGDPGLLTGITDEDGRRFGSFGYDIHGRVVLSTLFGANGELVETTRIAYPSTNLAQVTTSSGAVRTYTYSADSYRRPLTIVDASGARSMTYDDKGRILTSTDARGLQTRYTYVGNKLTSSVFAHGSADQRTVQTDWHATLNVPVERRTLNAAGALVAKANWTYNSRGQVLSFSQTDPISGAVRATVNAWCEQADVDGGLCPRVGLLLSVDGPRTDVSDPVSYSYHASDATGCSASPADCTHRKGDLWKVTNALGHVTETLTYDGVGRPLSVKDANGVVTEMTYHPRGWLTSRTVKGENPGQDRSMLIDYWPTGLIKRVTQADGTYVQYGYDAAHRLIDIADSAGNTIHYTLDIAGNRTGEATRDPGGALVRTLSRSYNQLGQLQTHSGAYGQTTSFIYDGNGNTESSTGALGSTTNNAYDPLNRLVQTIQDIGGIAATTRFQYDALDNLTRVTDPNGLNTDYAYNGFGDLIQLTSPDTGTTTYTYDSAGNRASQTDARAKTQIYTYDALNRLTKVTSNSPTLNYGYDTYNTSACPVNERFGKGKLTSFDDPTGNTRFCYNRFGDLVRKIQTTKFVFTTLYGYDASGRLATQTYPDGAVLDVVRDSEGRIAELGLTPNGGLRQVVLTGASYAPFGPSTGWTYGNGRSYLRSLDQDYRPKAIHDGGVGGLSLGFGFDASGNLTLLQDAAHTLSLAQYGYDALNRLTQVKDGATGTPIETYGYDATGNRTSVINAGMTTAYTYHAGSHRLFFAGGDWRSYHASGSTYMHGSGGNTRVFYYDNDAGRMSSTSLNGVPVRYFRYNAKGEQVWSDLPPDYRFFVYDEAGHLLGEYDNAGAPKQQILWFGDLPVGVLAGSGAGQQLHYIEPDHLGTPRVIIDGVRNVPIWKWDLQGEAFGATPPNQDPDNDGTVFVFDLRYPGQRYDSATGLHYNYFRDYDPGTARYVQSDPIGLMAGVSTYGYVSGSPLVWADMYGLLQWSLLPVQWNSGTTTGTLTRTFPGAPQSAFREDTLARTTMDWTVGATCSCASGGFSLNEFQVSLTPVVLLRQRYDTPAIRSSTRRDELDHVRDLNNWANGAKSAAEMFEAAFKNQTFPTEQACLEAARAAMQGHLSSSIDPAIDASRQRWDVSGKHRLIIP